MGLLIAILPYALAFIGWTRPTTNRSTERDTYDVWCEGKYQLFKEMTPSGEPQEFELADMDTLERVSPEAGFRYVGISLPIESEEFQWYENEQIPIEQVYDRYCELSKDKNVYIMALTGSVYPISFYTKKFGSMKTLCKSLNIRVLDSVEKNIPKENGIEYAGFAHVMRDDINQNVLVSLSYSYGTIILLVERQLVSKNPLDYFLDTGKAYSIDYKSLIENECSGGNIVLAAGSYPKESAWDFFSKTIY